MAFDPNLKVVDDSHYCALYGNGLPSFEIRNMENTHLFFDSLGNSFLEHPPEKMPGLHYCVFHSHHLDYQSCDLERCEALLKEVLWDIKYFEAIVGKLSFITHSCALQVLTKSVVQDELFQEKIRARITQLSSQKPS